MFITESESKKILVETGMGDTWNEKFMSIYNVDFSENTLAKSLEQHGLSNSDITDVILTHLHFDHTGGSTKLENGKFVPAFPNAKYHVQKEQYKWAVNPSDKDRGSFIRHTFQPLHKNGVLQFVNGRIFFDDEIELIAINGHTAAQQMVKISDSFNTFLFCGDLIPTLAHIRLPYIMGYDINPLITIEEKRMHLIRADLENWKIIFGHDHINSCATIKKTENGFSFNKVYKGLS